MTRSMTRREFLKTSTAGPLSLASLGCSELAPGLAPKPSGLPAYLLPFSCPFKK
ncbi:MAG: twin-arginine translocation signal domain-containing protein [Planctomycetota bacterium]